MVSSEYIAKGILWTISGPNRSAAREFFNAACPGMQQPIQAFSVIRQYDVYLSDVYPSPSRLLQLHTLHYIVLLLHANIKDIADLRLS